MISGSRLFGSINQRSFHPRSMRNYYSRRRCVAFSQKIGERTRAIRACFGMTESKACPPSGARADPHLHPLAFGPCTRWKSGHHLALPCSPTFRYRTLLLLYHGPSIFKFPVQILSNVTLEILSITRSTCVRNFRLLFGRKRNVEPFLFYFYFLFPIHHPLFPSAYKRV